MVVGGLLLKLTQLLNNLDNQCEMLTELSWICCLWLFVGGPPLLSFECCAQLILLTLTWDFAALLLSVAMRTGPWWCNRPQGMLMMMMINFIRVFKA